MAADLELYSRPDGEIQAWVTKIAQSDLLPDAYRGKPANVLLAVETGRALGISPVEAINKINIIKGKPTISPELMAALVRRAGHKVRVSATDTRAEVTIIRADDPDFVPDPVVWTIEKAKRAGIANRDQWSRYPSAMLRSRALSEACRMWASDALAGVTYTPEEMHAAAALDHEAPAPAPAPAAAAPEGDVIDVEEEADPAAPATPLDQALHAAILAGISDEDIARIVAWASNNETDDLDKISDEKQIEKITWQLNKYAQTYAANNPGK